MIDPTLIKALRVHPGLGIARVGNAPGDSDYVLAGEVPGMPPIADDGAFRDSGGRIRRQATRFRIYAELHNGSYHEVTADDAVIEWTVELANLKGGWYAFENAMDLPTPYAKSSQRRNAKVHGDDRKLLDIRPAPRSICGRDLAGSDFRFDSGTYYDQQVYLGELRTDEQGRLVVLGGFGASAPHIEGSQPNTFANNDGWHDDIADGPVFATVRFAQGVALEAEPGYVVVTPPNFAPGLFGVVTMADVVDDLFAPSPHAPQPPTSFTRDIWPIFDRLTNSQWVNHGLFMLAGQGSPLNAKDPAVLLRLHDAGPANSAFRMAIFKLFRDPADVDRTLNSLPGFYGDYYGDFALKENVGLSVTATMYAHLRSWSVGNFSQDWTGEPQTVAFAQMSTAQQVAALDRAGLHECLGGPFHPGIELTWFMRTRSLWAAPFRLKVLPRGTTCRQDYGDELTPEACLAAGGPLDGVAAGALTRAMGLPWQTDEASCLSDGEYSPSTYLSFPSFWGARVPNHVLSAQAWERANAAHSTGAQQLKHFMSREDWLRDLRGSYLAKIAMMIENWWELGILLPQISTPAAQALGLPALAWIETGRPREVTGSDGKIDLLALVEALDQPTVLAAAVPNTSAALEARRGMNSRVRCDVAIVGNGPAGAVTAIALRRHGLDVLLLGTDMAAGRTRHSAESMTPALLSHMAVPHYGAFAHDSRIALPCAGVRALWSTHTPAYLDYVRGRRPCGVILDRSAFDAHLLAQTRAAGVMYSHGVRVTTASRRGRLFALSGTQEGRSWEGESRLIVDATGKTSLLARQFGARRHRITRQRAVAVELAGGGYTSSMLWIEADRKGWWSGAVGPGGVRHLVRYGCASSAAKLPALLAASRMMREMASPGELKDRATHTFDAGCSALDVAAGDGWIAVGDAAIAFDPVSSQGLPHAIGSGEAAAQAIVAALHSDSNQPLREYAGQTRRTLLNYLVGLRDHYLSQDLSQRGKK